MIIYILLGNFNDNLTEAEMIRRLKEQVYDTNSWKKKL